MPKALPVATQRKILKLEQHVFKLEQRIVTQKARYEKKISALQAENHKLRTGSIIMTPERIRDLQEQRRAALEQNT